MADSAALRVASWGTDLSVHGVVRPLGVPDRLESWSIRPSVSLNVEFEGNAAWDMRSAKTMRWPRGAIWKGETHF